MYCWIPLSWRAVCKESPLTWVGENGVCIVDNDITHFGKPLLARALTSQSTLIRRQKRKSLVSWRSWTGCNTSRVDAEKSFHSCLTVDCYHCGWYLGNWERPGQTEVLCYIGFWSIAPGIGKQCTGKFWSGPLTSPKIGRASCRERV